MCIRDSAVICVVMDARRGQFYNALFRVENGEVERLCPDRAVDGVAPVSYTHRDVYKRQVESLAVLRRNPDFSGQILCLAGPPGVGKTSIVKSLDVYKRQEVLRTCTKAFAGGWTSVKLYFMMGLPTETMEEMCIRDRSLPDFRWCTRTSA